MKKIIKYIGLLGLVMLGLFLLLVILIVFSALKSKTEGNSAYNSQNMVFKFDMKDMPAYEEPAPIYEDSKEEALAVVNQKIYLAEEYLYASKVSDILKIFENDDYATMVYYSKKDSEEGALVIAKFRIRIDKEKRQYALLDAIIRGYGDPGKAKLTSERRFSLFCQAIQVFDLPSLNNWGIEEGNRFIFGGLDEEYVKRLKIEGQSPTEIIEYTIYGEKRYFWYYENLISDKPSSKFDIEVEEEEN